MTDTSNTTSATPGASALYQMIPGVYCVRSDLGTVAALGTVRRMADGYSFLPQPAGSNAERELALAGYHGRRLDGFATPQEAAAAVRQGELA